MEKIPDAVVSVVICTRVNSFKNSLARAVVKAPKSSHITRILRSLQWLKITERIEYRLISSPNHPTFIPA